MVFFSIWGGLGGFLVVRRWGRCDRRPRWSGDWSSIALWANPSIDDRSAALRARVRHFAKGGEGVLQATFAGSYGHFFVFYLIRTDGQQSQPGRMGTRSLTSFILLPHLRHRVFSSEREEGMIADVNARARALGGERRGVGEEILLDRFTCNLYEGVTDICLAVLRFRETIPRITSHLLRESHAFPVAPTFSCLAT